MRFATWAAAAAALCLWTAPSAAEAPARYLSLRGESVEARAGPGPQHRVAWVYARAGLPLLLVEERGAWRRVRDPDGGEAWVLAQHLDSRRTVYVRAATPLRRDARANARTLAHLQPGVVAAITGCDGEWRRIAVGGRIGWADNAALWGGDCAGL
jgi:SH3-like domain-containing protein